MKKLLEKKILDEIASYETEMQELRATQGN